MIGLSVRLAAGLRELTRTSVSVVNEFVNLSPIEPHPLNCLLTKALRDEPIMVFQHLNN
jgi:hypothetical protein